MWSSVDFPLFFAGLGLFLFGLMILERALATLSSESFRVMLRRSTARPAGAVLGGVVSTVVLQGSSTVGLLMMAFVGAGLLPLYSAVGVVLGANLGTTFTGWIVTTLGFRLDLAQVAVPVMGLGALMAVMFRSRERWQAWGGFVFGLGLLLFGLNAMKTAMEQLAAHADVSLLDGWPLPLFVLVGALFTALIRSSSACMMIILSALDAGSLDLTSAAALAVGADIGTTSTMALGAIGGSAIKKQLALSHVLFNAGTAALAYLLMQPLLQLVQTGFGIHDPLYALVAFHSTFNALGVLLFAPFIRPFSRYLERLFLADDHDIRTYIHNVPASLPVEAITAVEREVERLLVQVLALNLRNLKVDMTTLRLPAPQLQLLLDAFPSERQFADCYSDIKKLEGAILEYAGEVQRGSLDAAQVKKLHQLLSAARHGVYAAKALKDIRENLVELRHADNPALQTFYDDQLRYEKGTLLLLLQLMLGEHDERYVSEELQRVREQNRQLHQQVERDLFRTGLHQGADELATSTLLNVNREFRASVQNFAKAIGHLRLPFQTEDE